ncbi:MAG: response regulator transcription factor, partial [Bacteroidetes bacterium]|nr:response regulator transcription factor [Bacteroidota bacterium]
MSDSISILFVEDDPYLGTIIKDLLEIEGFTINFHKKAESALVDFMNQKMDFCLLDVMLPGMDGFELGRKIRALDKMVPILFLTAKSQKADVIEGFGAGADDYLKKPFAMEELVLRIRALLRRSFPMTEKDSANKSYNFGKYHFDYHKKELQYDGETHLLTHRETEMLRLFCENQNLLVERNLILAKVWGDDTYFNARSMDVFLAKLRKHFKNDTDVSITNVRGRGFKLLVHE